MLKVLSAVLSVLSAAISITIYTATLPAVQKQAADNAAAIEQIQSAIENIPEEKKLYKHKIQVANVYIDIYSYNSTAFDNNSLISYITENGNINAYNEKTASTIQLVVSSYDPYVTVISNSLKVISYTISASASGGSGIDLTQTQTVSSVFGNITDTVTEVL